MSLAVTTMTRCGFLSTRLFSVGRRTSVAFLVVASVACGAISTASSAQGTVAPRAAAIERAEQGARWADLKPAQRSALKPLERDWAGIDAPQKQKWLELSGRFPSMSPAEQSRVQARMADWAKLTPPERGQARMRFQEAKKVPAPDRQARWDAYQALPPEQRQQLATRAKAAAPPNASGEPPAKSNAASGASAAGGRAGKPLRDLPQAKSNVVPNPAFAAPPVPITPTVVQARPGATTTPISRRPSPPSHQQAGLPKIAATPEFVNKATLLPRRGPQGAATRPAASPSAPDDAAARR